MTLRVLVATPLGHRGPGGIDRVMDTLRTDAARLGPEIEVTFLTSRGRSIVASPFHMAAAMARIATAKAAGRADLLHINLSSNASAYRKALLCRLCRGIGLPYVLHLHGSDFAEFWPQDLSRRRRMIDAMFRHASGLILLGTPWRRLVETRLPELADRIRIVPNAAPAPREVGVRDDSAVGIVFLGRLGERKGSPTLIHALAALDTRSSWRAVLAGDGPVAETRRAVADAGIADRVEVPGWLGPAAVTDLLARSDILVLPSMAENLPMSVIESMAAGLAVIATPVGATGDIIEDGVTGLLVRPTDVEGLTVALRRTIDDAELRGRLGAAARAFHRANLDVPRFTENLAAAWQAAVERGAC